MKKDYTEWHGKKSKIGFGDVDRIETIDPEEFKKHITWGEVGGRLIERALELQNKIL